MVENFNYEVTVIIDFEPMTLRDINTKEESASLVLYAHCRV